MKRLDIITSEGYIEATLEQCEYEGLNKEQTALKVKKIIDEAIRLVSKNESLHLVSHCSNCKQPLKAEKVSPVGYNICTCNWDTSNCG